MEFPLAVKSLINTLIHMIIAINTYVILHTTISGGISSEHKLHVIFLGTGYQFLLMEGILTLSNYNIWSNSLSKDIQKHIHMGFAYLGTLFIIVGFSIEVSNKKTNHFTSAHGVLGLISFLLTLLNTIIGTVTGFSKFFMFRPTPVKAVHAIVGCTNIVLGLISLSIGIISSRNSFDDYYIIIIFIILTMVYILINPILNIKVYIDNMRTTVL